MRTFEVACAVLRTVRRTATVTVEANNFAAAEAAAAAVLAVDLSADTVTSRDLVDTTSVSAQSITVVAAAPETPGFDSHGFPQAVVQERPNGYRQVGHTFDPEA
jgi:hypothetical protein